MRRSAAIWVLTAVLVLLAGGAAHARAEEHFGNAPVHEGNYDEWPGLLSTLNHPSRVFRIWANGSEAFYYQGDAAALNDTLSRFVQTKTRVREVVLRPGPGMAQTFNRTRQVPFHWSVQLTGGLSGRLSRLATGDKVWPQHPVLTIFVDRELDMEQVKIPDGLVVTTLAELKARTREGLKSGDKTVRGGSSSVLAELDPFDDANRLTIAALLKDPDGWVRLNAAGALATFGSKARANLPELREALTTNDAVLKLRLEEAIATIERSPDAAAAEAQHQANLERIRQFLHARRT